MSDKRPISEPKRAPKMIRVLFKPGTSSKDMAAELFRLREENKRRQGENPPKPPESS